VWFTATPWPDLIVAVLIAGLFLYGAWTIIVRANHELADVSETSN
jgi:Co/Zn/Cd efflux system component